MNPDLCMNFDLELLENILDSFFCGFYQIFRKLNSEYSRRPRHDSYSVSHRIWFKLMMSHEAIPDSSVSHFFFSRMFQVKPVACFQQQFFIVARDINTTLMSWFTQGHLRSLLFLESKSNNCIEELNALDTGEFSSSKKKRLSDTETISPQFQLNKIWPEN